MRSINALALLVAILVLSELALAQDKDRKSSKSTNDLVTESEPGIRVYGIEPEFSAVGQVNGFDVCPDGKTLAFAAGGKVKFWSIEKKKIVGEIEEQFGSNYLQYSGDGLKLFAMGWGSDGSEIRIYDAITKDRIRAIKPKEFSEEEGEEDKQQFHFQAMSIAPDDDKIAMTGSQVTFVVDVESGEKISKIKHKNYSQSVSFTPDGSGIMDSRGKVYDVETGEEDGKIPGSMFGERYIQGIKINPRYDQIATSEWNRGIKIIDWGSKKQRDLENKNTSSFFHQIEFSGNGKLLAATTYPISQPGVGETGDSELYVWESKSGKLKHRVKLPISNYNTIRFGADNESVFLHSPGQIGVTQIALDESESVAANNWHQTPIYQLGFLSDGETLVAAAQQGAVMFHDIETGKPNRSAKASQVINLAVGPEDNEVVVIANYNGAHIVNVESGKKKNVNVQSFERPSVISRLGGFLSRKKNVQSWENFAINSIVFSDDNKSFYLAMRSRQKFRLNQFSIKSGKGLDVKKFSNSDYWETKTDDPNVQNFGGSQMQWRPRSSTVSRNGKYFSIVNDQRKVFLIDAENDELMHEFDNWNQNNWPQMSFSPDSSKLLVSGGPKALVFDVETGEELVALKIQSDGYYSNFAFSGNGERVASVGVDNQVSVFDFESGESIFSRKGKGLTRSIALSSDGNLLALGKSNCQFEIWDLDELGTD